MTERDILDAIDANKIHVMHIGDVGTIVYCWLPANAKPIAGSGDSIEWAVRDCLANIARYKMRKEAGKVEHGQPGEWTQYDAA